MTSYSGEPPNGYTLQMPSEWIHQTGVVLDADAHGEPPGIVVAVESEDVEALRDDIHGKVALSLSKQDSGECKGCSFQVELCGNLSAYFFRIFIVIALRNKDNLQYQTKM